MEKIPCTATKTQHDQKEILFLEKVMGYGMCKGIRVGWLELWV